jgi:hypothetical protein
LLQRSRRRIKGIAVAKTGCEGGSRGWDGAVAFFFDLLARRRRSRRLLSNQESTSAAGLPPWFTETRNMRLRNARECGNHLHDISQLVHGCLHTKTSVPVDVWAQGLAQSWRAKMRSTARGSPCGSRLSNSAKPHHLGKIGTTHTWTSSLISKGLHATLELEGCSIRPTAGAREARLIDFFAALGDCCTGGLLLATGSELGGKGPPAAKWPFLQNCAGGWT